MLRSAWPLRLRLAPSVSAPPVFFVQTLKCVAARWRLRDSAAARAFATADIYLPAERFILGLDAESLAVSAPPSSVVPITDVLPRVSLPSSADAADAATHDVIAIYSNNAFVDLVKNLVCNFYTINIDRYVIFSLDDVLCNQLRVVDAPCYFDTSFGGNKKLN